MTGRGADGDAVTVAADRTLPLPGGIGVLENAVSLEGDVVPAEMLADLAATAAHEPGWSWESWGPPDTAEPTAPDADALAQAHPSEVGLLLERVDLDDVDDHTLVELAATWQKVASWAAGNLAQVAGALADRDSMNPTWPESVGSVARPCVAGDELAIRLGWSRRMAQRLVEQGTAFRGTLAWTGDALTEGAIDPAKAAVLVDTLADEPLEVALAVQDDVLPDAPGLTPTQLRRRVHREVLRLDPAGTRSRHEAAHARRRVDRPRMLDHGMAGIWAVLDAADALRVDNVVDTLARTARDTGDPRTLDQLRADVLTDLALGRALPGADQGPDGAASQESGRQPAHLPGHVPGHLPVRAVINVTVPLSTLLGTGEEPAELAGYGPVHPDTARALAAGGTWRRLVTDPLTGAVLDVGRTRYRPPAALADHVRHRDRTCVRGGCSRPAQTCDLDHTIAWDDGGTTADHNLDPLCRRDHLLKTHAGHRLDQPVPGTFRWTTPTGHTYRVTPGADGVVTHEGRPPPAPPRPSADPASEGLPPPF